MSAAEVEQILHSAMPSAVNLQVLTLSRGALTLRLKVKPSMLRPGGTVSGPTLFAAADSAMYAVILGHLGPKLLAVTTDTMGLDSA